MNATRRYDLTSEIYRCEIYPFMYTFYSREKANFLEAAVTT